MSSALISYSGVCEAGRRNWLWNSEALDGLRSELERLRPWVGSMSCWAFCTKLEKFNMAQVGSGARSCRRSRVGLLVDGDPFERGLRRRRFTAGRWSAPDYARKSGEAWRMNSGGAGSGGGGGGGRGCVGVAGVVLCRRGFVVFQRPSGAGRKGSRRWWSAELAAALECRRDGEIRVSAARYFVSLHGCGALVGSLYLARCGHVIGRLAALRSPPF